MLKTKHPLYQVWKRIKRQCYNSNAGDYLPNISLCEDWADFNQFLSWCMEEGWSKGLTVVRLDLNKNFEPDNCTLKQKGEISAEQGRIGGVKLKGKKIDKEIIEKRKATCLQRYGFEFAQKSDSVKEKYRQKCLSKYGVNNTSQLESSKIKARQTCMEKYGVPSYSQTEEFKKSRRTGKNRENRRNIAEYVEWCKKVFKRDNYTCQVCGKKGKINAHHIYNWLTHIDLRYDVNNGITVCTSIKKKNIVGCHQKFHKLYTNLNNTKEQFEEFKAKMKKAS